VTSPSKPAQSSAELSRGLVRKVVLASVLAALVYAGLALYSDVKKLGDDVRELDWSAFGIGVALVLGNYALRIVRWQYYLRRIGVVLPWVESSLVFLCGFVMSVTPGKLGEVFKSVLLYESRAVAPTRTAPVVIAERLTDLIALVVLVAAASLVFEHGAVIAATAALAVGALLAVCAYQPLGNLVLDLAARIPALSGASARLREAYAALWEMTRPAPLLVGTLIAIAGWSLECVCLWEIARGFPGVEIGWDGAAFAYSASTLVGALAMMPGGLGVTEVGMATLLRELGGGTISPSVASATTILVRLATLWLAVVVGVIALAIYRRLYGKRLATLPT
jgi:uncharacterized membrane protein YbhN (UPF0104 family)